jgi:hypothetical protein
MLKIPYSCKKSLIKYLVAAAAAALVFAGCIKKKGPTDTMTAMVNGVKFVATSFIASLDNSPLISVGSDNAGQVIGMTMNSLTTAKTNLHV